MTPEKLKLWKQIDFAWSQIYASKARVPFQWGKILGVLGFGAEDCDEIEVQREEEIFVAHKCEGEYRQTILSLIKKELEEFKKEISEDWARDRRREYLEAKAIEEWQELKCLEELQEKMPEELKIFDDKIAEAQRRYRKTWMDCAIVRLDKVDIANGKFTPGMLEQARSVPIETLVEGRVMNAGGGRKKMLCPFHTEKTSSFVIYPDNHFFCFGCGAHGANAIDFVMQKRNLDFRSAVEVLLG